MRPASCESVCQYSLRNPPVLPPKSIGTPSAARRCTDEGRTEQEKISRSSSTTYKKKKPKETSKRTPSEILYYLCINNKHTTQYTMTRTLILLATFVAATLGLKAQDHLAALMPMPNHIEQPQGKPYRFAPGRTAIAYPTEDQRFAAQSLASIIEPSRIYCRAVESRPLLKKQQYRCLPTA